MIVYDFLETDFGPIYVAVEEMQVCKIALTDEDWQIYNRQRLCRRDTQQCSGVMRELYEYLRGERQYFTVSLALGGTAFLRQVWQELCRIPYGQVRSYGDIAARIGQPQAYRAVGMANYQNPLPILIPCHRVVGKTGKMTGYQGGIAFKQYLLHLEGIHSIKV